MNKLLKYLLTAQSFFYYPFILRRLKANTSQLFFIFPSWQIGGSERVHADIMALFKEVNPVCLITEPQSGEGMKSVFARYADVIYLWRWGTKASFKKKMLKRVAAMVNKQKKAVVFGSNNLFLYDLIPLLDDQVKIIDLTHSFTPDMQWCETYSLRFANRLSGRVVLGRQAVAVYRSLYKKHKVPTELMECFVMIPNLVAIPAFVPKSGFSETMQVLFVARNSWEKRPELFFRIAEACQHAGLPVSFTAIGDFDKEYNHYRDNVQLTGVITDHNVLSSHYQRAHLILVTSVFEGFPMVLLEGMAHGVVPVATAIGEIPGYVSEHAGTGKLVEADLPAEELVKRFVEHIRYFLNNRARWEQYSEKARSLVTERVNQAAFAASYRRLLWPDIAPVSDQATNPILFNTFVD